MFNSPPLQGLSIKYLSIKKLRPIANILAAIPLFIGLGLGGITAALSAQETSQSSAADGVPNRQAPPPGSVGGPGDINLYPKRIVINARREIATIGLFNRSVNPGRYEITITDFGMTPDGQLLAFDNGLDEGIKSRVQTASPYLRHSPRRVTLRGTESQLVRVLARIPPDLPDGEYRSHFSVTAIPEAPEGSFSIEQASGQEANGNIGISIRPRFGISIPVIVRIGETTLNVGISDAQLLTGPNGQRAIAFNINREGTRSAFGDIIITARGSDDPIAITRGIGVYPEISSRQIIIPIGPDIDPALLRPGNQITIDYIDDDYEPGTVLAQQSVILQ